MTFFQMFLLHLKDNTNLNQTNVCDTHILNTYNNFIFLITNIIFSYFYT